MKLKTRIFFAIIFLFGSTSLHALDIKNIRIGKHADKIRIVIDVNGSPSFSTRVGNTQKHIFILCPEPVTTCPMPSPLENINQIYLQNTSENKKQIVLETKAPITLEKVFTLPPTDTIKHFRYVIDIKNTPSLHASTPNRAPPRPVLMNKKKVIIIDAGHGGQDPGTIGINKTKEKDVTLKMAYKLKSFLEKLPDVTVKLTRDKDIYVRLPMRVKFARDHKADLFLSLHADSSSKKETRGVSIYTLSKIASDKEAERLAAKENKTDYFHGLDLKEESLEVASILIDLTKRETMNLSSIFAQNLEQLLKKDVRLLNNTHRFANFAVLRTPDVPGVLIELGYLSNKEDEQLLKQDSYLSKIAQAITNAVVKYFQQDAFMETV